MFMFHSTEWMGLRAHAYDCTRDSSSGPSAGFMSSRSSGRTPVVHDGLNLNAQAYCNHTLWPG